jgi:hypothetical protein
LHTYPCPAKAGRSRYARPLSVTKIKKMPSLDIIEKFIKAVENESHDKVIEKFYTDDASIQENQDEPRVGKENLIENEKKMLRKALVVHSKCIRPIFQVGNSVVIKWKFQFEWKNDTITEIEEIAYQEWKGNRIKREQFFLRPKTVYSKKEIMVMS